MVAHDTSNSRKMHVLLKKRGRWCWMQKGKAGSRKGSWQLVPLTGSGFSSFFLLSLLFFPLSLSLSLPLRFFKHQSYQRHQSTVHLHPLPSHVSPSAHSRWIRRFRSSLGVRRAEDAFPTDTMALYFGIHSLGRGCGSLAARWRSFDNARSSNSIVLPFE